jgi:hypothetical protein
MSRRSRALVATAVLLAAVAAAYAATGGLPRSEATLPPKDVAASLSLTLGIQVAEVNRVYRSSGFTDVEATYVGGSSSERLLVIVFRNARATIQVLGEPTARLDDLQPVRRRNVVVLYGHRPGTDDRAPQVAAALGTIAATR